MSSLRNRNIKIKVVVSPFHEMLCSLHVLFQPEHHPKRLQWALQTIARMPDGLVDGIMEIGRLTDGWTAVIDFPDRTGEPMACAEGIDGLSKLPDAELAHLLLNGQTPIGDLFLFRGISGNKAANGLVNEKARSLMNTIGGVRQLLVGTLTDYMPFFDPEWSYVQPWMDASAARTAEMSARSPEALLNTLHPRLHCANGAVTVQKASTYYFPFEKLKRIYLFPSTFIFPHLLTGWTADALFLPVAVDVPGVAVSDSPPGDLLRQLKALGDENRLRLMKLLWKKPHCTKQLAPILAISEAAVSKHLKLLHEAELVAAERKGNYMFYSVRPEMLDALTVLQRQYLEQ